MALAQIGGSIAETRQRAGLEVLDEHVRSGDQRLKQGAVLGSRESQITNSLPRLSQTK